MRVGGYGDTYSGKVPMHSLVKVMFYVCVLGSQSQKTVLVPSDALGSGLMHMNNILIIFA